MLSFFAKDSEEGRSFSSDVIELGRGENLFAILIFFFVIDIKLRELYTVKLLNSFLNIPSNDDLSHHTTSQNIVTSKMIIVSIIFDEHASSVR